MKNLLTRALMALSITLFGVCAYAQDKLTVLLDWFVNPDHAAIVVAQQKGFFAQHGLDVTLVEPADPSLPPKLLAAGKGDLAVDYQPQLQTSVSEGLPIKRIGTLISTPLNTVIVLKSSGIKHLSQLKGKTVGYSVSGFEQSIMTTMLQNAGVNPKDIKWVNVNFNLEASLLSHKVDAVVGGYRNFELNSMKLEKHPGLAFYPEEHGVPAYDELVITANAKNVNDPRFGRFLDALQDATVYILNHPDAAWKAFVSYRPKDLDNKLNRMAWVDTLPRLTLRPRALDNARYAQFADFLKAHGIIQKVLPVSDYAVQVP